MSDTIGKLTFVSWMRRGLAAGISGTGVTQVSVDVQPTPAPPGWQPITATADVSLVGPADIVGFDARAITKKRPEASELDAEYQLYPMLELDQADLPWRYSPVAAAGDVLRPWLALVVLEEGLTSWSLDATDAAVLPKLTVSTDLLPDLTRSMSWAHLQVPGVADPTLQPTPEDLAQLMSTAPEKLVSRILCAETLAPNKAYQAFLVPTFAGGREAGGGTALGPAEDAASDAWVKTTSPTPIILPVYYRWEFRTGTTGSFKDLASRLRAADLGETVGWRALDATNPGLITAAPSNIPLQVEGALQSQAAATRTTRPGAPDSAWVAALKTLINAHDVGQAKRVVAPPAYGRWHAMQDELGVAPGWFHELNTDPTLRVAAALGTAVVQKDQQSLMASAWKQIGDLPEINRALKVLQLGREGYCRSYERHFQTLADEQFLQATAPVLDKVKVASLGTTSVKSQIDSTLVGNGLMDPAWRRFVRSRGRARRRQGREQDTSPVETVNNGQSPARNPDGAGGPNTYEKILDEVIPGKTDEARLEELRDKGPEWLELWGFLCVWVGRKLLQTKGGQYWWLTIRLMRFGEMLLNMAGYPGWGAGPWHGIPQDPHQGDPYPEPPAPIGDYTPQPDDGGNSFPVTHPDPNAPGPQWDPWPTIVPYPAPVPPPTPPLAIDITAGGVRDFLRPEVTLVNKFWRRVRINGQPPTDPTLNPIMAAPEFRQPMYRPLRDLSPEWILPGVSELGSNIVAFALTNQRFIEGFMVGLNHEMSRELLWNEYPTDMRGTYFRQFWDRRGCVGQLQTRDITQIHTWPLADALGTHRGSGSASQLVLVIRADLIHHFPNVLVFARPVPTVPPADPLPPPVYPTFQGLLPPDLAFWAFPIAATAIAQYQFLVQEHPGEPRFQQPSDLSGLILQGSKLYQQDNHASLFAAATFSEPTRIVINGSQLIGSN